ncbi:MAG: hypothetical protein K1X65_18800 [Caldilineales bacterium]|nr:hypothetical protein [Caldilineales bacterium]
MDALLDILVILGMFFLRLGVPLLLVVGVGYLLRRLDARWEAEAREQAGTATRSIRPEQRPGAGQPAPLPARPAQRPLPGGWPGPQRLPAFAGGPTVMDVFGQPCWAINDCDPAARAECPAYHQPENPCWLARFQADGHLPDRCQQCPIFAATSGAGLFAAEGQPAARQWLQ